MADWSLPTNASTYTSVLPTLNEKLANAAKMDFAGDTNLPTGTVRHDSSTNKFQEWNGTAWVDLTVHFGADVGIGTTTPSGRLDVSLSNATVGVDHLRLTNGSATGQTEISAWTNGTLRGRVRWDFNGGANYVANGGGHTFWTGGDSGVGTQVMILSSTGRLGLGGTPTDFLDITTATADTGVSIRGTISGARPMVSFFESTTKRNEIFSDNGGFVSGSAHALVARSGGSGGLYLASTATSWTAVSDIRHKKNVRPLEYGLAEVLALGAIRYDYLEDESDSSRRMGFSAQDVLGVIPEAVTGSLGTKLGLSREEMMPTLWNAVRQLAARVIALETN
jgi:hypothetical protein